MLFAPIASATIALTGCATTGGVQDFPTPSENATVTDSSAESASESPLEGTIAPDFVALGSDGSNVSLSSLRGRTVILFFYTRDETPMAIREATEFRDAWAELRREGIVVVGVSADGLESHKAFAERLDLPYPLVSDLSGSIARAYGVPAPYGMTDRRTFVIGPSGTIERVYTSIDPATHVSDVVSRVANRRGR